MSRHQISSQGELVEYLEKNGYLTNKRAAEAMARVDRRLFVPSNEDPYEVGHHVSCPAQWQSGDRCADLVNIHMQCGRVEEGEEGGRSGAGQECEERDGIDGGRGAGLSRRGREGERGREWGMNSEAEEMGIGRWARTGGDLKKSEGGWAEAELEAERDRPTHTATHTEGGSGWQGERRRGKGAFQGLSHFLEHTY
jgi:hypothetical protein